MPYAWQWLESSESDLHDVSTLWELTFELS
jgi:hypothetical protein